MFYRPGLDPHGLAYNPFKALVAPRPIGWISSRDANGRANLAPYSFFNAVADDPPLVVFGSNGGKPDRAQGKDSLSNIRETGEFVVNVVSMDLFEAMNRTSASLTAESDEFELVGLEKLPGRVVGVPRVAGAPAALECRLWKIIDLPGQHNSLVVGEVVGVHIDEASLRDGRVDVTSFRLVGRLGYRDYAAIDTVFSYKRPDD